MKTYELLQEETAQTPFGAIKELNVEFKALAAQFDLTLVAGMGWPQIGKDGAWYGGGIGSKGGNAKKQDTLSLPIEARRKGFFKELAKMLESMMAQGHVVKIAAGAARGTHQEDAIKGRVYDQLTMHAIKASPPGNVTNREAMPTVAWYVSLPAKWAGKTAVRIIGRFYKDVDEDGYGLGEGSQVDVGGSMDIKKAKALEKQITQFMKDSRKSSKYDPDTKKSTQYPPTKDATAFFNQTAKFLKNQIGWDGPQSVNPAASYFSIATKVLTKETQLVDMDEWAKMIEGTMQ